MKHFELTVTVNPRRRKIGFTEYGTPYGKMRAPEQWNILKGELKQLLGKRLLYRLVAEFHSNLNVHCHGHVMVPDDFCVSEISTLKKDLEVMFGRSSFTLLNNLNSWLSYIDKYQDNKIKEVEYKSMLYSMQLSMYNQKANDEDPSYVLSDNMVFNSY